MKRIILTALAAIISASLLSAQDIDYKARYDRQVSKVGNCGLGVENILDKWEAAEPENADLLYARFLYYFAKSQTEVVQTRPTKRYLGMNPVLTLKDSTGTEMYYYSLIEFDDSLFRESLGRIEKAAKVHPKRLDFRTTKATALLQYEEESPDMTLEYLLGLVDENYTQKPEWEFPGYEIDKDFFPALMQEYCGNLYAIATDSARNAFKTLSERILKYDKKNPDFLTNIGSYYVAAKDFKKAFKYYDQAIKINPEHYSAVKNAATIAIQIKDAAKQKKYLTLLLNCGSENEKKMAQARLEALNKK